MHVLYLDDSGSAPNKKEEYFVLGGVCVPENSIRWLKNQIESLACQYDNSSPELVEFHAADIFGGKKYP